MSEILIRLPDSLEQETAVSVEQQRDSSNRLPDVNVFLKLPEWWMCVVEQRHSHDRLRG